MITHSDREWVSQYKVHALQSIALQFFLVSVIDFLMSPALDIAHDDVEGGGG